MATTKKISELTAITSAANADLLYIVHDPAGVPTSNKITVQDLLKVVNNVSLAANAYSNAIAKFGTIVISNNVISTSNSSQAITIRTSSNPFNAVSNSYVQLQYNANSSASQNDSAGSNWLWVDDNGVNMQIVNSSDEILSNFYLANSSLSVSVNGYNLSFNSNGEITFPDTTVQTTAYTGNKNVVLANSASLAVNSSHEVILFDPNSAGEDVYIYLPNSAANGKVYTVKNIDSGSGTYDAFVNANGNPTILETPTSTTSNSVGVGLGESYTWIFYNGNYVMLSKHQP